MDSDQLLDGRIGEGLVRMGEMTPDQVKEVLEKQKEGDDRLFGEIAVDLGFIDLTTVIKFLEQ